MAAHAIIATPEAPCGQENNAQIYHAPQYCCEILPQYKFEAKPKRHERQQNLSKAKAIAAGAAPGSPA
jgi:hypothetical protein